MELLHVLQQYPNLYIIGAGASYGIVPTTNQLSDEIIRIWLSIGGYGAFNEGENDTFDRVVSLNGLKSIDYAIVKMMPRNSLDWLISYYLSVRNDNFPQYRLFNKIPGRSIILSYNLDGLTRYLRHKHIVLFPHGKLMPGLKIDLDNELFFDLLEYNVETPWKNETLIIRPEQDNIYKRPDIEYLIDRWKYLKNILIIGYSFSMFNNSFDDYYSFMMITELIRHYGNNVIIIDPYPDYIKYHIEEAINKKVSIYPLKWNILSPIINNLILLVGIMNIHKYWNYVFNRYKLFDV